MASRSMFTVEAVLAMALLAVPVGQAASKHEKPSRQQISRVVSQNPGRSPRAGGILPR